MARLACPGARVQGNQTTLLSASLCPFLPTPFPNLSLTPEEGSFSSIQLRLISTCSAHHFILSETILHHSLSCFPIDPISLSPLIPSISLQISIDVSFLKKKKIRTNAQLFKQESKTYQTRKFQFLLTQPLSYLPSQASFLKSL